MVISDMTRSIDGVMNLSSLLHSSRQRREQSESQVPSLHPTPNYRTIPDTMASTLMTTPYTIQTSNCYSYVPTPQAPPSPPVEVLPRCSLPSISSLLGFTDGSCSQESSLPSPTTDVRPSSQQVIPRRNNSVVSLPPTPPMQPDVGFDDRQSSFSSTSTSHFSVKSTPSWTYPITSAINNVEPHTQRQLIPAVTRRATFPASPPSYTSSQFTPSPQSSISSYHSSPMQLTPPASQQPAQISNLYHQRPLPQEFTPPLIPVSVTLEPSSGTNPWQHHHYISPSSQASFPPSQDRYICQTCRKAFSRPSSLRIHSHSHTGEKPFSCPHHACGKSFSVRSNMKRHERGCHGFQVITG